MSILQGNDFDEALNVPDINNKSLKVISCLNCRYPPASPDQKSVPNDVYSYMEMKRNTAKEEPSSPVPSHTDDILIDNTGHHSFLTEIVGLPLLSSSSRPLSASPNAAWKHSLRTLPTGLESLWISSPMESLLSVPLLIVCPLLFFFDGIRNGRTTS